MYKVFDALLLFLGADTSMPMGIGSGVLIFIIVLIVVNYLMNR